MSEAEDLAIQDTTGLTDADWAEINKLRNAHKKGGAKAVGRAMQQLAGRAMSVTNDAPVGGSAGLSALPKNTLENFAKWGAALVRQPRVLMPRRYARRSALGP
jgi:hypothetical protein